MTGEFGSNNGKIDEATEQSFANEFMKRMTRIERRDFILVIEGVVRQYKDLKLVEKGIELSTMVKDYLADVDFDGRRATVEGFREWLSGWKERMQQEVTSAEVQTAVNYGRVIPTEVDMMDRADELMDIDKIRKEMQSRKDKGGKNK